MANVQQFDELCPHGVFTTDADLRVSSWNRWMELHSGRKMETVRGQSLLALYPSLQERGLDRFYREALEGKVGILAQGLHGHVIPLSANGAKGIFSQMQQTARIGPLLSQGRVVGTITFIQDVTDRAWRERELKEEVSRLEVSQSALKRRDAILEAVGRLAQGFLRAPAWRSEIEPSLERMGKVVEASAAFLFVNARGEDGRLRASLEAEWVAPGIQAQRGKKLFQDFSYMERGFSRWEAVLSQGEPLVGNVRDFPESERKVLAPGKILSVVTFPVLVRGEFWGLMGFIDCWKEREWWTGEVDALKAASNVLGSAIQRSLADGARQKAEEKYREIVENAVEGIFQSTPDGRFLMANTAMARMLGYESAQVLCADISDIGHQLYLDPDDRKQAMRILDAEGVLTDFQTRYRRRDGSLIWVSVNSRAVRDAGGRLLHYEGNLHDITQRRILEEQLRHAQKVDAVGRLAGGLAHDMNNLTTVVTGYASLILESLGQADPLRQDVEEIKRAGERAASLVRQLLTFSRKQVVEPQIVDLNDVIQDTEKMLRRLIGEDIQVETVLGPDLNPVKVDPGQMEQVLMNLVVNARDAMPRGGRLTIETANVDLDEAYVRRHATVEPGQYVMMAVSDTGVGMAPAILEKMFEPFFTTKGLGKGTGLGLATVYGIVKQSGGNIWVYSEPDKGSTFKVYLPCVRSEEQKTVGRREAEVPFGGTETVLLVEDEKVVRQLAEKILSGCGYRVVAAKDGNGALELLQAHGDEIHLMLTDVVMPGVSGKELAERAAVMRPQMKVLYMSGYTDNAIVHHGVLDSGVNFLQKPFTPSGLSRRVRGVLDGEP
jgi:PAS domain S-box-containing protein